MYESVKVGRGVFKEFLDMLFDGIFGGVDKNFVVCSL